MRKALSFCALLCLTLVGAAQAKVLVVAEATTAATYSSSNALPGRVNLRALGAVTTILDRYGADYVVMSPAQVNTQMCKIGIVNRVRKDIAPYRYDSVATPQVFHAVIHVGFNGTSPSSFSGYRPDSLTLSTMAPQVPQLMLIDDHLASVDVSNAIENGSTDSTWVAANGYQTAGAGSGNHEGEGTIYVPGQDFRWFDTIYGASVLKRSGQPTGGMRTLLSVGANPTFIYAENEGIMPLWVDSLSTANADTMKVWEKLNSHVTGARVVFATAFSQVPPDSVSGLGAGEPKAYTSVGVNWPVLMFSLAHLDSISNRRVLGEKKVLGWGAAIVGAGTTSDRRHPGGFFLADSNIVAASGDSTRATGINLVIGADPESLAVRPWQVAIFNRFGNVRWAPWVRVGLDTAVVATSVTGGKDRPVDPWGRYRNRAIYGDNSTTDPSIYGQLVGARTLLAAQVGSQKMSPSLIAPDFDFSPYQMRAHQNANLLDSLMWMTAKLGSPLIVNTQARDQDPAYLRTNPKGWNINQGSYRSALLSEPVRVLGVGEMTIRGSRAGARTDVLSFVASSLDSVAPLVAPNASVREESRFWNSFFGPSRDYSFGSYDGIGFDDEGWIIDTKDRLYDRQRASIIVLPAQAFGGQSAAAPNRWGFFVLKHLMHATKAINYAAGRVIIANQFPEDIEP